MMSVLDLPWKDILITSVLSRLSLKDCYSMRCVSKSFKTLIEFHLQNLKTLKIVNKKRFPSCSFQVLYVCENLRVLNLYKCDFLSDEILIPLLIKNSNLIEINLSGSKNITSRSLQPIILQCNAKVLKLAKCLWLTPGALEALTFHQSSLEYVDISYSNFTTDDCLILFLKKFVHLKTLSLEGIPQVGDRCMFAISKNLINIQCLNVAYCPKITDVGISQLKNCARLQSLAIQGCQKVTRQCIKQFKSDVFVDIQIRKHSSRSRYLKLLN